MSISDLLDRPIAFQRAFVRIGAGITGALMLSQAVYWSKRTNDPDGWFAKGQAEWEDETGLSRFEQETARKTLTRLGVLEEVRQGMPARLFYRVNIEKLESLLFAGIQQSRMRESRNQECGNPAIKNAGIPQSFIGTETTTENTSETTSAPASKKSGKAKKPKAPELTFVDWLDSLGEQDPIKPGDPIFKWMEDAGIPEEFQELAWLAFVEKYPEGSPKKYSDWPAVVRKAIREDWLKVWYARDGAYLLTTKGEQLRRVKEARDRAESEEAAA